MHDRPRAHTFDTLTLIKPEDLSFDIDGSQHAHTLNCALQIMFIILYCQAFFSYTYSFCPFIELSLLFFKILQPRMILYLLNRWSFYWIFAQHLLNQWLHATGTAIPFRSIEHAFVANGFLTWTLEWHLADNQGVKYDA